MMSSELKKFIKSRSLPWALVALLVIQSLAQHPRKAPGAAVPLERRPTALVEPIGQPNRRQSVSPPPEAVWPTVENSVPTGYSAANLRNDDPKVAALTEISIRRAVIRDLGAFVDSLDLDPTLRKEVLEVLSNRAFALRSARLALGANNLSEPDMRQKVLADATAPEMARLASILDPAQYASLSEMLDAEDEYRELGKTVSLDMSYAGLPLTPKQKIDLAIAMNKLGYESKVRPANSVFRAIGEEPQRGAKSSIRKLAAEAEAFLSPEQLEVLRVTHNDRIERETVLDDGFRAMLKAKLRQAP